jgi:hypothetical protein
MPLLGAHPHDRTYWLHGAIIPTVDTVVCNSALERSGFLSKNVAPSAPSLLRRTAFHLPACLLLMSLCLSYPQIQLLHDALAGTSALTAPDLSQKGLSCMSRADDFLGAG